MRNTPERLKALDTMVLAVKLYNEHVSDTGYQVSRHTTPDNKFLHLRIHTPKDDEYAALVSAQGVETRCEIEFSDVQNVKARLAAALPAGQYTLKVYTRSGFGDQFGVRVATRKVSVA